ncbi:MAG: orotidine-5'-phosphate decarboxylase [Acidimicrobiales bacterium]
MAEPFRARLATAVAQRGGLCAGIDPSAASLEKWSLPDTAAGATEFAMRCLEALAGHVGAVKPNAAFYEQFGSPGLRALESVLAAARELGVLTVGDAKRGDIASTNAAYARAWLASDSPLSVDAVTVSPYLGAGALSPFFELAEREGRGVLVVVRSSNIEGRDVQGARRDDGRPLEVALLDEVRARPDSVGAVIGLMAGAAPLALPEAGFYLAPGLLTQGAEWADFGRQFAGMASATVLVNLSRPFVTAGPDPNALRDVARESTEKVAAQLRQPTG